MARRSSYRPLLALSVGCFLSMLLPITVRAGEACSAKSSTEIAKVFTDAISLNDRFKKSLDDADRSAYDSLRPQVERFSEEDLFPCVRRAAKILSKGAEPVLMQNLLRLALSYENSADETIPYSLGIIFAHNPGAIENGIKEFSEIQRQTLTKSIQWGWQNVKSGLSTAVIRDRDERLAKLSSYSLVATVMTIAMGGGRPLVR